MSGSSHWATFALLETEPELGRPFEGLPKFRELFIPLGDSCYVAFYRYESKAGAVHILAFQHQKEAGYWLLQITNSQTRGRQGLFPIFLTTYPVCFSKHG